MAGSSAVLLTVELTSSLILFRAFVRCFGIDSGSGRRLGFRGHGMKNLGNSLLLSPVCIPPFADSLCSELHSLLGESFKTCQINSAVTTTAITHATAAIARQIRTVRVFSNDIDSSTRFSTLAIPVKRRNCNYAKRSRLVSSLPS